MSEPKTTSPLSGATPTGRSAAERAATAAPSEAGSSTMAEKVAKVIEVIRPAIQADNGDIELRNVDTDTGVVTVELLGACVTCPISAGTLKDGVERIMKSRVEGVTAVRHVGEELAGDSVIETGTRVSL